jgi:hypothetical protein
MYSILIYIVVFLLFFSCYTSNQGNFGCHPLCLAHAVFGLQTEDLCRCSFCGATGEPDVAASYVYSVYVSELASLEEAEKPSVTGEIWKTHGGN